MKVNGHWVPCVRNSSYSLMPIRLMGNTNFPQEETSHFFNEVMLLTQIKGGCTLTTLPRDVDRIKQFTNRLRLSNSIAIPGDEHCSAAI